MLLRHGRDAVCFDCPFSPTRPRAPGSMRSKCCGQYVGPLSESQRIKILRLLSQGLTQSKVAKMVGCSQPTVSNTARCFKKYHSVRTRPRSGRPRKISPGAMGALKAAVVQHLVKPRASLANCQQWLLEHRGLQVAPSTLHRSLKRAGLRRYTVRQKPLLTAAAIQHRKKVAIGWSTWRSMTLARAVFSDEASVGKQLHFGKEVVFDKPHAPFLISRVRPVPASKGITVNVWAAITNRGILAHRVYEGVMNSDLYLKIMRYTFMPAARKRFGTRRSFWSQQDNARYHHEARVKVMMHGPSWRRVRLLDWPSYSPDLNIIENLWPRLRERVVALKPRSKADITTAIDTVIAQMNAEEPTTHYFKNLFASFPTRCQEVVAGEGFSVDHEM